VDMLTTTAIGGIAGGSLGPLRVMSGEDVAASCYLISGYRGDASCKSTMVLMLRMAVNEWLGMVRGCCCKMFCYYQCLIL
jgi:hypothetical protein